MITSLKNQMVQRAKRLRDSRRFRHAEHRVFVEGFEENKQALYYGWKCLYQLSGDESFCESSTESSYVTSPEVMTELCKKTSHSVIGIYEKPLQNSEKLWEQNILFVLDEIEKPGNVGAIFRTAAATGFRSFVAVKQTVDLQNPQVIRNSLGHSLGMNCIYLARAEILQKAQAHGFELVLLDANRGEDIFASDLPENKKLLFIIGREHEGIHRSWYDHDYLGIKIPMDESVNSLNVSVASGVLFYQLRQNIKKYHTRKASH